MKATKTLIASAIVAASIAAPAMAVEGLSANAAVTSDYLWRGMTQTSGDAAVSGGIDYDAGNGVYLGTWTSNVTYGTATQEVDFYFGYAGDSGDISYDVGYVYYAYNGEDSDSGKDLDFSEVYASISYDFLTAGVAALVDDDFGSDFADALYYNVDAAFEIAQGLELGLHVGYYDVDGEADSAIDYSATLSKGGFSFGLYKVTDALSFASEGDEDLKAVVSYSVDFDL